MDRNTLLWEISKVLRLHRSIVNREAVEAGVYMGQHRILGYIAQHEGCTQNEVAQAMQQSAASISVTTKRLQEEGLLDKYPDKASLRVNRLRITEKGKENGRKFRDVMVRTNERMFEGFSDEELGRLASDMERLYTNLDRLSLESLDFENQEKPEGHGD